MKRIHSKLLNETASVADNGAVTFDSGVKYSNIEIETLKGAEPEDVKAVHWVKGLFGGEVFKFDGKSLITP